MQLGTTSIRYLLYGINFLFVITGVIIISVGISIRLYYKNYLPFIQDQYLFVPNFLVIIGVCIFVIAIVGWCGAVNENSFVTLMFATFLLLIFFLEISVGISGYLLKSTTEHSVKTSLHFRNVTSDKPMADAWSRLQEDLNCCGIINPQDWLELLNGTKLPESCCTHTEKWGTRIHRRRTEICTMQSENLHRDGCIKPLQSYLTDSSFTIEVVGFTLAVFQLIGLAISCQLSSEFRRGYQTV